MFHDGLDVPDEMVIKSALYGNLKYAFPKDNPASGKLIADRDGAWNPDKNRSTSAVMYIRNDGEPIIIHNYWADRPFPPGLFSCREISTSSDGTFHHTLHEKKHPASLAAKVVQAVKDFCLKFMPR